MHLGDILKDTFAKVGEDVVSAWSRVCCEEGGWFDIRFFVNIKPSVHPRGKQDGFFLRALFLLHFTEIMITL